MDIFFQVSFCFLCTCQLVPKIYFLDITKYAKQLVGRGRKKIPRNKKKRGQMPSKSINQNMNRIFIH